METNNMTNSCLGLHEYGEWKNYHYWTSVSGFPNPKKIVQIKTCLECGKKKSRKVKL